MGFIIQLGNTDIKTSCYKKTWLVFSTNKPICLRKKQAVWKCCRKTNNIYLIHYIKNVTDDQ